MDADHRSDRPTQTVQVNLALIGFGHVARRFARLLEERRDRLGLDDKATCRIVAIATGRHGYAFDAAGLDMHDALARIEAGGVLPTPDELQSLESVEFVREACRRSRDLVVIETTPLDIGAGQPAIDHIRAALEGDADVITANKGPVAFAFHELASLARARGRSFLFEGTVMDGIPIFNLVRETLPGVEILGIRGVVNSTTNYILSEMEAGRAFQDALTEMQRAGIAEADASLDVDGWDASAKVAALANVLLGARMTPHDVSRTGISRLTSADIEHARARKQRIRLVAEARRGALGVTARVGPVALDERSLLAMLVGMQNALIFETDLLGELAVAELDGGLTQTAYALLSDLVSILAVRRRDALRSEGPLPPALQ